MVGSGGSAATAQATLHAAPRLAHSSKVHAPRRSALAHRRQYRMQVRSTAITREHVCRNTYYFLTVQSRSPGETQTRSRPHAAQFQSRRFPSAVRRWTIVRSARCGCTGVGTVTLARAHLLAQRRSSSDLPRCRHASHSRLHIGRRADLTRGCMLHIRQSHDGPATGRLTSRLPRAGAATRGMRRAGVLRLRRRQASATPMPCSA